MRHNLFKVQGKEKAQEFLKCSVLSSWKNYNWWIAAATDFKVMLSMIAWWRREETGEATQFSTQNTDVPSPGFTVLLGEFKSQNKNIF